MKIFGNLLWLFFGGFAAALEYFAASLALMFTIVGIPFALQTFKIGIYVLWPFGQHVVYDSQAHGCLHTFMNILWFFLGGIWIWLTHIVFGLLLLVTIIGIPLARKQFELAGLALHPFGRRVVMDSPF